MKDTEREEVKKIVDEAMTEKNEKIKKEKKSKKKILIIGGIIIAVLLALATLFFFLFIFKPKYEVTIKTGGGKLIKGIVIEDNVVKEMPEVEAPEGKTLVTWINKNNEAVRAGITLEDDDEWEPVYRNPEEETVTLKFETGTDEKIADIIIPKGSGLIVPVKPNNYSNWKFLYWVDKNEYVAIVGTKVMEDTTYYAYWWKPGTGGTKEQTCTVSFDTGTDEKIDSINLIKGSKYIFMTPQEPNGNKVFGGWLDDKGNLLNAESVVEKDITLKAKWLEYTCPENCIQSEEDPLKCTRTTTVNVEEKEVCKGTEYKGYCIDTAHIAELDCARQCSDGYPFGDTEVSYPVKSRYLPSIDAYSEICCVKKINRVKEKVCPEGYTQDGDTCTLIENLECTLN